MARGRKLAELNGQSSPALVNDDELGRFADRLEKLEIDRREIVATKNDVLQEASDKGFGKRPLNEIVKRRLETPEAQSKRQLFEEELDAMLARLGMLADLPLGQAAMESARAN